VPDQAVPPPDDVSGRPAAALGPDDALGRDAAVGPDALGPDALEPDALGRPHTVRPAPEPLKVNVARLVLFGIGLWAVAFLGLLPFRSRLDAAGNGYWLWTCVAGVGLGVLGYVLASRAQRPRH
jgi:hypothetical protein